MNLLSKEDVLNLVPQQGHFRFIDKILDLDDAEIQTVYTFHGDEFFYPGHFPGNPITPGVILLEIAAQAGLVAYGIYLTSKQAAIEDLKKMVTVFTEAEVEFLGIVRPGEKITVKAWKIYFRRSKLKVRVECYSEKEKLVLRGTLAGMGVHDL